MSLPEPSVPCAQCGVVNPPDARFCGECGAERVSAVPKIGQVIDDRYRIVEQLGSGGMGVVYLVEHVQMGKPMAMKLLHRELERDTDTLARFQREAEAASKLSHPNTVQVFDFGRTRGGSLYLVMEFVDGADWGQELESHGPMRFDRVARIMQQVCASVHDAHAAGIIHRDLKPENVMLTAGPDGEFAKVLDFGLAKLRGDAAKSQVTQTGAIIGTPYYMSPEQIRGEDLDQRSDIYSLGAMMYSAVVGAPPFDADTPVGVLSQHLTEEPVPPSQRAPLPLPPKADQIILRAMHKNKAERFDTALELREALKDYVASSASSARSATAAIASMTARNKPVRRSITFVGLGLLALGLLAAGVLFVTRPLVENEPNHTARKANKLPEDQRIDGKLGRRLSEAEGDVDLYEIHHRGDEPVHAQVAVTEIPNMDIELSIVRTDGQTLLATADATREGGPEMIPNFPLEPGRYMLRVTEAAGVERPTENVSDRYSLSWEILDEDASVEREPNNALEQADTLSVGAQKTGWIGWRGDVDTYCLAADAGRLVATVSGIKEIDLIVRTVDTAEQSSYKVDRRGIGEHEKSNVVRSAKKGQSCVEVSAKDGVGEDSSRQPYTITFEAK